MRTRGEFRASGYCIGSGVVEADCKTVFSKRHKQSGMFLSHRGGADLLALRCLMHNPAFPSIWNARRAKPPKWSHALN